MFSSQTYAAGYPASLAEALVLVSKTVSRSRCVHVLVTACVAAGVCRQGQVAVYWYKLLHKVGETRVYIVGVHGNDVVGRVTCHILVHDRKHLDAGALVGLHDITRSKATTLLACVTIRRKSSLDAGLLLTRIEVELQCVSALVLGVRKDP